VLFRSNSVVFYVVFSAVKFRATPATSFYQLTRSCQDASCWKYPSLPTPPFTMKTLHANTKKISLLSMSLDQRVHCSSLRTNSRDESHSTTSSRLSTLESPYALRSDDDEVPQEPPQFIQETLERQASSMPRGWSFTGTKDAPDLAVMTSLREMTQAYDRDTWRMFNRIHTSRVNGSPKTRQRRETLSVISPSRHHADTVGLEEEGRELTENCQDEGVFDMDL